MYYFSTLLISTMCYASGFFGQAWVHQEGELLSVNADKVDTAALLNEWCGACEKQCIIDHDIKHKLSISLSGVSCDQLLSELLSSASVSWDQHGTIYIFSKSNKGHWVPYKCQNRRASELELLLKPLLTPAAKGERMLSDDISQTLWLPKSFFLQHKEAIQALDQEKMLLNVHVSFLEQMMPKLQDSESLSPDAATISKWLLGEPVHASWLTVLGWISGLVEIGTLKYITHTDLTLQEGVLGEYKVDMYDQVKHKKAPTRSSVGSLKVQFIRMSTERVELHLVFSSGHKSKDRVEVFADTIVSLSPEESVLIAGSTQSKVYKQHQCPMWAQKLRHLHPLLCQTKQNNVSSQNFIALTLHQVSP